MNPVVHFVGKVLLRAIGFALVIGVVIPGFFLFAALNFGAFFLPFYLYGLHGWQGAVGGVLASGLWFGLLSCVLPEPDGYHGSCKR